MHMKTYTETNKLAELHEPPVGSILYDINKTSLKKELFTIIGRSYNEIAMVRLFEHAELNTTIAGKWYQLCNKLKSAKNNLLSLKPLYTDPSRLIIKDRYQLIHLLHRDPDRLAGYINKRDLENIVASVNTINTISADIKNKYFNYL